MDKKNCYIIIVTYNGMPWIEKCLESCGKHAIVVVDNNSTDGTVVFIEKKYPRVHIIPQCENLGFGQANNVGISYALNQQANYVFLLNQDAYLEPETIEKLIETHSKYPEYGILSPIHTNAKKTKLDRNFSIYVRFDKNESFYSDFVLQRNINEVYSFPFINAAGWLLPKECLLVIGGFDPMFFVYGEDDNFCQRVIYHGYKIGVVPYSFMIHDREDRVIVKENTDYKKVELGFKVRLGNINTPNFDEAIQHEFHKLRKSLISQCLQLKLANFRYMIKCVQLLKSIRSEIVDSRNLVKSKGAHYLDV
jgi:GT2 family glycosyltransferase